MVAGRISRVCNSGFETAGTRRHQACPKRDGTKFRVTNVHNDGHDRAIGTIFLANHSGDSPRPSQRRCNTDLEPISRVDVFGMGRCACLVSNGRNQIANQIWQNVTTIRLAFTRPLC